MKDMSSRPKKRKDKQADTSYDQPKRHIVLSEKRNIVGVEDKTDMSEDYNNAVFGCTELTAELNWEWNTKSTNSMEYHFGCLDARGIDP